MKEILFFSNNKNKIVEITNLIKSLPVKILNLGHFDKIKSPEETGLTFEENANIKSLHGLNKFNIACFADDSGICIEAINNKPGVNSKEFLEKKNNSNLVLEEIIFAAKEQKNFSAYFQSTICLSLKKENHIFFTGKIHGKISEKIKGVGGFGYDPIFIPNDHNITFAEMSLERKNKLSHRAIAVKKLLSYLTTLI